MNAERIASPEQFLVAEIAELQHAIHAEKTAQTPALTRVAALQTELRAAWRRLAAHEGEPPAHTD
jgi:hypothetical protein